ncbi:DUF4301 family protein [Lacinutrix neustonica]|uniref:DUF4301 family protein n=1 Tax=Lacinutrix neustonica TaxID=2980107 RepID=UPI0028BE4CA7|nr:DUF4301 family protein [Lacinutrix neustonica]
MFKFLFQFLENYSLKTGSINAYINKHKASELSLFLVGLEKFPFYETLIKTAQKKRPDYNTLTNDEQLLILVKTLLAQDDLNYSFYPKGSLPFHKYKDHLATAFEEHLFEAALYASTDKKAKLHFTISKGHKSIFDTEFIRIKEGVERKTDTKFEVTFSYQRDSTDTIAVNLENEPVLNLDGSLHFRPSGHGALLENLNDFNADIIFIKNIDNVVVCKYQDEVAQHKKVRQAYF